MKTVLMFLMSIFLMTGVSFASDWTGEITLGANLQSGNNDRASASMGAKATQRVDNERFSGKFLFNYSEENEEMSARNVFAKLQYDHFFTKEIYSYLNTEILIDKFKDLNLRNVMGSGVGYQILDSDKATLSLEAGLSYLTEDLRIGEDNHQTIGRLAGNASIKVSDTVTVTDSFVISPKLKDRADYQIRNEASVSLPLATQWVVKLSHIYQYDSMPSAEIKKKDTTWMAGIGYNF